MHKVLGCQLGKSQVGAHEGAQWSEERDAALEVSTLGHTMDPQHAESGTD